MIGVDDALCEREVRIFEDAAAPLMALAAACACNTNVSVSSFISRRNCSRTRAPYVSDGRVTAVWFAPNPRHSTIR